MAAWRTPRIPSFADPHRGVQLCESARPIVHCLAAPAREREKERGRRGSGSGSPGNAPRYLDNYDRGALDGWLAGEVFLRGENRDIRNSCGSSSPRREGSCEPACCDSQSAGEWFLSRLVSLEMSGIDRDGFISLSFKSRRMKIKSNHFLIIFLFPSFFRPSSRRTVWIGLFLLRSFLFDAYFFFLFFNLEFARDCNLWCNSRFVYRYLKKERNVWPDIVEAAFNSSRCRF